MTREVIIKTKEHVLLIYFTHILCITHSYCSAINYSIIMT